LGSIGIEKLLDGFDVFPALGFLKQKKYERDYMAVLRLLVSPLPIVRLHPGGCINTSLDLSLPSNQPHLEKTLFVKTTEDGAYGEISAVLLFQKDVVEADMWLSDSLYNLGKTSSTRTTLRLCTLSVVETVFSVHMGTRSDAPGPETPTIDETPRHSSHQK
jgi:hypothetical protein